MQSAYSRTYMAPPPMPIGGYLESSLDPEGSPDKSKHDMPAKDGFHRYKRVKSAVEAVMDEAENAQLVQYADMISGVSGISDNLTKLKTVNAWVNMKFEFDLERSRNTSRDPAVDCALQAFSGGILEQTYLKMIALENAGFDSDNIRFVSQRIYQSRNRDDKFRGESTLSYAGNFGVVAARVGEETWALNVLHSRPIRWDDEPVPQPLDKRSAWFYISDAARMEPIATQMNASGKTIVQHNPCCFKWIGQRVYVPKFGFNSHELFRYQGPDAGDQAPNWFPEEAENARKKVTTFTKAEATKVDLCGILGSAYRTHYTLDSKPPRRPFEGKEKFMENLNWGRLIA